jgi:hypothetical protein
VLILGAYALVVFVLCFVSVWYLRRKLPAILIVAFWTLAGPILMQLLNFQLVGYLDPFWKWAATVQGAVALVASTGALGVCAAMDQPTEAK